MKICEKTEKHFQIWPVLYSEFLNNGLEPENCAYIFRQRLRKVCSNIRATIDHFKPIPNLTKLFVFFGCPRIIALEVDFENESHQEIIYEEQEKSMCRVNQSMVKQDLCITCIEDLKTCISRRDFSLDKFRLCISCNFFEHSEEISARKKWFLTHLKNVLTPKRAPLKVRKFEIATNYWEENLMFEPIKWLEPITLEIIELETFEGSNGKKVNEMLNVIADTNQWKYAKEFAMKSWAIQGPVDVTKFVHFEKIDITVENWTNEVFFNWTEVSTPNSEFNSIFNFQEILYSPSFIKYKISFRNCSIDNDIYNLLGLPYRTANGRTTWYFKMPEKDLVLHVLYYTSKSLIFTRVDIEDVPEVVVMNFDVQLID